jgi:hypothetical protein
MSALLETETVINLTTAARVNLHMGRALDSDGANRSNGLIRDKKALDLLIGMLSRDAMVRVMKRAVQKKSRTETFDIADNQRDFWVLASPIHVDTDIDTDITIYKNTDTPRDFTGSSDEVSADYILCDDLRRREGRITIERDYAAAVSALQIAYTGGMATETVISGTNGAVTGGTTLTSAGQTFTTKGVAVGDMLAITESGDADHGLHPITAIPSETTLTAPTLAGTASTGLDYEIISGTVDQDTIVGKYEDIALAVDIQAMFMWQNRDQMGIQSEGIAGASFTFLRPVKWLDESLAILKNHARRI